MSPFVAILVFAFFCTVILAGKHNRRVRSNNRIEVESGSRPAYKKPLWSPLIPSGKMRARVYTYDDRPIRSHDPAKSLILEILPGRHSMRSIFTNYSWTGSCCVAYEGQPIGFVSDSSTYFNRLSSIVERHGIIRVHAKIRGYDSVHGYPLISLMLPKAEVLKRY